MNNKYSARNGSFDLENVQTLWLKVTGSTPPFLLLPYFPSLMTGKETEADLNVDERTSSQLNVIQENFTVDENPRDNIGQTLLDSNWASAPASSPLPEIFFNTEPPLQAGRSLLSEAASSSESQTLQHQVVHLYDDDMSALSNTNEQLPKLSSLPSSSSSSVRKDKDMIENQIDMSADLQIMNANLAPSSLRFRYSPEQLLHIRKFGALVEPENLNALLVFMSSKSSSSSTEKKKSKKKNKKPKEDNDSQQFRPTSEPKISTQDLEITASKWMQDSRGVLRTKDVMIQSSARTKDEANLNFDEMNPTTQDTHHSNSEKFEKIDTHVYSFEEMLLPKPIVQALSSMGFDVPSPIQFSALPWGRLGVDLIAQAKSGTGKTIVFCIIALEVVLNELSATKLRANCDVFMDNAKQEPFDMNKATPKTEARKPLCIIMTPTREIAIQIYDVIISLIKFFDNESERPRILSCIGGLEITHDRKELLAGHGCDILIGTPGRIKALVRDGILDVSNIRIFILDEADKLLDNNFRETVSWICRALPEFRQVMTFSATFPAWLLESLRSFMRNPKLISMYENSDPSILKESSAAVLLGVEQKKLRIVNGTGVSPLEAKVQALKWIIHNFLFHQCIVFSNNKSLRLLAFDALCKEGQSVSKIAGDEIQNARNESMASFKSGKTRILVATDLVSRGIDVKTCDLVINLDVPVDVHTYLHRIGRSGRYGTKGTAITIYEHDNSNILETLEQNMDRELESLSNFVPKPVLKYAESKDKFGEKKKDEIEFNEPFASTIAVVNVDELKEDAYDSEFEGQDILTLPEKIGKRDDHVATTMNVDDTDESQGARIFSEGMCSEQILYPTRIEKQLALKFNHFDKVEYESGYVEGYQKAKEIALKIIVDLLLPQ